MGQLVGAVIITWLLGNGLAWIIRKVANIGYLTSNVIAVVILVPLEALLYNFGSDGRVPFASGLMIYGLGGIIALVIMAVQARMKAKKSSAS